MNKIPECEVVVVQPPMPNLDQDTVPFLNAQVESIAPPPIRLVLDMSKVLSVNSHGLTGIVDLSRQVRGRNGELKLACVSKFVHQALEVTRLTGVFHIYDNIEDASKAFEGQEYPSIPGIRERKGLTDELHN